MSAWLKALWQRLVAWREQNESKLADTPASSCCSHPLPGGAPAIKKGIHESRL